MTITSRFLSPLKAPHLLLLAAHLELAMGQLLIGLLRVQRELGIGLQIR